LIFEEVSDIEKCFANDGDYGRLMERQLFRRASVKRKSRSRPGKNCLPNLTPLRFCPYFNDDDSASIASRIDKRNVKIAV
jgi:hypothetical protein